MAGDKVWTAAMSFMKACGANKWERGNVGFV